MGEMSYQREANVLGADYFERQGWHPPKEKMTKEDLKHIFLKSVMDLRNKDLLEQDSLLDVFEDVIEPYISELEQQIEKMKRHCNCKHRDSEGYCEVKRTYLIDLSYDGCDKWELED